LRGRRRRPRRARHCRPEGGRINRQPRRSAASSVTRKPRREAQRLHTAVAPSRRAASSREASWTSRHDQVASSPSTAGRSSQSGAAASGVPWVEASSIQEAHERPVWCRKRARRPAAWFRMQQSTH
jgi:hypothetical protein